MHKLIAGFVCIQTSTFHYTHKMCEILLRPRFAIINLFFKRTNYIDCWCFDYVVLGTNTHVRRSKRYEYEYDFTTTARRSDGTIDYLISLYVSHICLSDYAIWRTYSDDFDASKHVGIKMFSRTGLYTQQTRRMRMENQRLSLLQDLLS